jgi:uncharacterized protein YkwD
MHLRLTLIASLTAAVLALGPATASAAPYDYLLAPMTQCGGRMQVDTSLSTGEQERVIRCMHNYTRARTGRAKLAGNSLLQTSSDRKVWDGFRCNAFSHNACGLPTLHHVHGVGYTRCGSWRAGENIAYGTGSYGSVRSIMRSWLNSTNHRTNILDRRFREIGLAVRKGTFLGRANAQVWTTHFGTRYC